jgi:hypothetical protein
MNDSHTPLIWTSFRGPVTSLSVNGLATDLDTEHGGTDANKRDGARQVGRLNVAGLQL